MLAQLIGHFWMVHAICMAGGVQVAHFDQHDIRLIVIFQNIQRQRHGQQIQASVGAHDITAVLVKVALHQVAGGGVFQPGFGFPAFIGIGNDHGHVHVIRGGARNRPGKRAGGQALFSGYIQQSGNLYILFHVEPRFGKISAAANFLIVKNAMPVGITTGQDGGMTGIRQGRPDRFNVFNIRAGFQKRAEVGHGTHFFHIARAKRIDAKNQYFTH